MGIFFCDKKLVSGGSWASQVVLVLPQILPPEGALPSLWVHLTSPNSPDDLITFSESTPSRLLTTGEALSLPVLYQLKAHCSPLSSPSSTWIKAWSCRLPPQVLRRLQAEPLAKATAQAPPGGSRGMTMPLPFLKFLSSLYSHIPFPLM